MSANQTPATRRIQIMIIDATAGRHETLSIQISDHQPAEFVKHARDLIHGLFKNGPGEIPAQN